MAGPLRIRGASIPTLDGLRGVAILGVLLFHFTQFHPSPHGTLERWAYRVCDAGWIGVDLFFVLSGFLITSILIESKGASRFFSGFYMRRVLRIFPLYYGALVLFFIVLPKLQINLSIPVEGARFWYWLYLANVRISLHGWEPRTVAHFWSLSVEEHFYLFWPFVVRFASLRVLGAVCVLGAIGAAALRGYFWSEGVGLHVSYVFTPTRLDSLTIGAALAVIGHGPSGLRPWRPVIYGAGLIALGSLAVDVWIVGRLDWGVDSLWAQTGLGMALAVVSANFVALAIELPKTSLIARVLASRALRTFGRYSYGIYVFHLAIDEMFRRGVHVLDLRPYVPVTLIEWAIVSIERTVFVLGFAMISYHLFERWFLELKPRLPGSAIKAR